MKIFILLLMSFNTYAMSFPHTEQIYTKILQANKLKALPLRMENDVRVNAHTGWWAIYVNLGMLRYVHNDDEMALVLGHELGHYKLHHWMSTPDNEYAADAQGAYYMRNAGYNICRGAQALYRSNRPDTKSHPASKKRYHRLGCKLWRHV